MLSNLFHNEILFFYIRLDSPQQPAELAEFELVAIGLIQQSKRRPNCFFSRQITTCQRVIHQMAESLETLKVCYQALTTPDGPVRTVPGTVTFQADDFFIYPILSQYRRDMRPVMLDFYQLDTFQ